MKLSLIHSITPGLFIFLVLAEPLLLRSPALAQPSTISKEDKAKAKKLFDEAAAAFKLKDYSKALSNFEASYRLSREPLLLSNIGHCYFEMGRYEEAQQSFETFLKVSSVDDPSRPEIEAKLKEAKGIARFESAERLFKLLDYEGAAKEYAESYRLLNSPEMLFNLGQCYRQLGRTEDAIKSFKNYLREVPDAPNQAQVKTLLAELEAKVTPPDTKPSTLQTSPKSAPTTTSPFTLDTQTKSPAPKLLYGGAAASGALGLTAVGLAFSIKNKNQELLEQNDPRLISIIQENNQRASTLGGIGVGLVAAALVTGGAGFLLSKRAATTEVSLSFSSSSINLIGSF